MTRRILLTGGPGSATAPDPVDPEILELPWSGPTNLVVDGNSIAADFYTSIGTLDNHLMMYPPLLGSGATHSCWAVSGDGWNDLVASHGVHVDDAWVEGATNALFAWETTNSAFNYGMTSPQIVTAVQTYIDDRRAAHPGWRILIGGSIPRMGTPDGEVQNTAMETADAYLKANWETMGADGFVDFRAAEPAFDHHGTSSAPFFAHLDLWNEKTAGSFIHLTDLGKVPIALAVNEAIAGLSP